MGQFSTSVNTGAYYYVDPTAREFDRVVPTTLTDNDRVLRFSWVGSYGELEVREVEARYDKLNGALSLRAVGETDWIRVATIAGAPDLDLGHFLTVSEVAATADAGWFGG